MSDEPVTGALCDGHEYEHVTTYDLSEDLDRYAFGAKLDTFDQWYEDADEVFDEEDAGHRHFIYNGVEVRCNVQQVTKRLRNIYWEVTVHD